jgi:hypothetical protein
MLRNLSKIKESILILRQMVPGGDNLQAKFFYFLLIGPMFEIAYRDPRTCSTHHSLSG